MKIGKTTRRRILAAAKFILFFALSAGVVTCSFLLFFQYAELEEAAVRRSAPITFVNIIFLSLIFTVVYEVYRRIAVDRPVKRILKGIDDIMKGDFSVRIKKLREHGDVNEFDAIIDGFNKMAKELSSVETLRSDFIANVSHELKRRWPRSKTTASCLGSRGSTRKSGSNTRKRSPTPRGVWRI